MKGVAQSTPARSALPTRPRKAPKLNKIEEEQEKEDFTLLPGCLNSKFQGTNKALSQKYDKYKFVLAGTHRKFFLFKELRLTNSFQCRKPTKKMQEEWLNNSVVFTPRL